jgi:hypothetical protein
MRDQLHPSPHSIKHTDLDKVTLGVHLFFDEPFANGMDTSSYTMEDVVGDIKAVLSDLNVSPAKARPIVEKFGKYLEGIRFASDGILLLERFSWDTFLTKILYEFAESVMDSDKLRFVPERSEVCMINKTSNQRIRQVLRSVIPRERDYRDLQLYSFGELAHSCVRESTLVVHEGMRKKAIMLACFCDESDPYIIRDSINALLDQHSSARSSREVGGSFRKVWDELEIVRDPQDSLVGIEE